MNKTDTKLLIYSTYHLTRVSGCQLQIIRVPLNFTGTAVGTHLNGIRTKLSQTRISESSNSVANIKKRREETRKRDAGKALGKEKMWWENFI